MTIYVRREEKIRKMDGTRKKYDEKCTGAKKAVEGMVLLGEKIGEGERAMNEPVQEHIVQNWVVQRTSLADLL